MLKIRFQRTGRKNDPAYRIVVTEHTAGPRAGTSIATVGSYHPKTKHTVIDAEEVKKWLANGAKASGTVHNLLIKEGVIEGEKVNVLPKKSPIVKEEEETAEEAAPASEAEEGSEAESEAVGEETPAEENTEEEAPAEEKKEEAA